MRPLQGSFLKPKPKGGPRGHRLPPWEQHPGLALALTKLLRQRVFTPGLCLLLLLGAHVVVLEEAGQLVPQHRDVWEGPHEGQLAIQVHLGHLQGWVAHKGPLAPAVHLGVPPLPLGAQTQGSGSWGLTWATSIPAPAQLPPWL